MAIWNNKNTRGASLTSFRHDKERIQKRRRYLGFAFLFALSILLFRTPVESGLSSVLHVVLRPLFVLKENTQETFSGFTYLFSSKKSLALENARLKDALDLVAIEGYAREALRRENDDLKKMLGRNPEHELLLARVLASAGVMPYDTLVVDVGSADGVTEGMSVYADGDFILGEVTQAFGHSAVVTLYSASGNELSAYIGATSTPTIAYGMGGGNFRSILPKGVEVSVGDLVDIPSLAPSYLGVVEAVEKSEQSSLQEIYYSWPLNVGTLQYVYLAKPTLPVPTASTSPHQ